MRIAYFLHQNLFVPQRNGREKRAHSRRTKERGRKRILPTTWGEREENDERQDIDIMKERKISILNLKLNNEVLGNWEY